MEGVETPDDGALVGDEEHAVSLVGEVSIDGRDSAGRVVC